MFSVVTHSAEETRQLGRWLGRRLGAGDFVALVGDLGAGKTHLSGGVLEGLGVERTGGSPTFTLLWEYQARVPVYHWDVYRLCRPEDLEDLGYEEYFFGDGVNLVEWADKVEGLWPEDHLRVDLSYGEGENDRVITFSGAPRYAQLLEELKHADFSA
ncbi:MAG TPA: tRNA (adenosine(37)-N6)-threonylcarbamoyltransferase complex ATPase subunit type 1 TsaE [Symbiobacteriaceae bacterium]|nr:tRNA (adenosine(37)-N6)-threonylcarbamoyltransferase complex ATPase subunit type 1 TsaE [Symbiobacteriaceae bacterium]